jgi:lipopolysaccharide/colanic/teichoic acid biosynthesis glycosyltransferase
MLKGNEKDVAIFSVEVNDENVLSYLLENFSFDTEFCAALYSLCAKKGYSNLQETVSVKKEKTALTETENMLKDLLDKNEIKGPAFKIKNDPRITRVGRFIRKTSIDELPQLWNVLRGEMSIVGPRPPLPREVAQYTDYQKQRLLITPGITCYWQVQPKRNSLSFDEWLEWDLKYIAERGFWTDMKIFFKTIGAVIGMEGV